MESVEDENALETNLSLCSVRVYDIDIDAIIDEFVKQFLRSLFGLNEYQHGRL